MFNTPKTIEEARAHRYNKWGGNPEGIAYREGKCAYEVHERGCGALFYQCLCKNGKGTNGLYCGTHAKLESK